MRGRSSGCPRWPGPGGRRRRRRSPFGSASWSSILGESGRELGVQFGPRVIRQQLVGHVALSFGLRVIVRQIHRARRGVGDGLIHFGPRVEVQQRGDDLAIDLAAVVVAGKGRADGRGHGAAREP